MALLSTHRDMQRRDLRPGQKSSTFQSQTMTGLHGAHQLCRLLCDSMYNKRCSLHTMNLTAIPKKALGFCALIARERVLSWRVPLNRIKHGAEQSMVIERRASYWLQELANSLKSTSKGVPLLESRESRL